MPLTTYAELQTAIANWVDRTDLTSDIPDFITLAEGVLKREMRTLLEEKRAFAETVADQSALALPTDFNGMRNLFVRGSPKISLTQVNLDKLYRAYASDYSGKPLMFAVTDEQIIMAPTPDSAYTVEMAYWSYPVLSDVNTSNSVLTRHPDLYLMWSLVYAYEFIYGEENEKPAVMAQIKADATALLESAKADNRDRQFGTVPLRALPQVSV